MDSRLLAAAATALIALSAPAFAIETVTLPQNPDGTTNFQNPGAAPTEDQTFHFSTDENGSNVKVDGFGTFHFSARQGDGWPGDPDPQFRTGQSTGNALNDAKTPGSEFYNPFGH